MLTKTYTAITANLLYDEENLLKKLSHGDERAFEAIYKYYSPRIFANLLKLTKSETLAQEILQIVFIKLWDAREKIRLNTSFSAFLFKIAENKMYDFLRQSIRDQKRRDYLLIAASEKYTHIEEGLLSKENMNIILAAIESLPPQRKQVFKLCKIEGLSYEEVSVRLGISTSTISDHIVKATRSLRDQMQNDFQLSLGLFVIFCIS
ncbi:MAG: RNA polymerase sigma-70 factor [Bacteroidetes bacterium]|nr:RNA polymerase sigma-70 factor [Bacteroidota bacterium]